MCYNKLLTGFSVLQTASTVLSSSFVLTLLSLCPSKIMDCLPWICTLLSRIKRGETFHSFVTGSICLKPHRFKAFRRIINCNVLYSQVLIGDFFFVLLALAWLGLGVAEKTTLSSSVCLLHSALPGVACA